MLSEQRAKELRLERSMRGVWGVLVTWFLKLHPGLHRRGYFIAVNIHQIVPL